MKRIALDVDDVLAAFTPHAHDFHGKELQPCNYWCADTVQAKLGQDWFAKIIPNREFWDSLPVLSPASDIGFEVDCYISSFPQEMYESRINWLSKNGFPNKPLYVSANKLELCKALEIDILVDDKPETMEILKDSPIRGIHFINHYATFEPVGEHVTNLKQVMNYL